MMYESAEACRVGAPAIIDRVPVYKFNHLFSRGFKQKISWELDG